MDSFAYSIGHADQGSSARSYITYRNLIRHDCGSIRISEILRGHGSEKVNGDVREFRELRLYHLVTSICSIYDKKGLMEKLAFEKPTNFSVLVFLVRPSAGIA